MAKKSIEVFWAPAPFTKNEQQWNFFYGEPRPIYQDLAVENKGSAMIQCPAIRNTSRNIFSLDAQIEDRHIFPDGFLEQVENSDQINLPGGTGGKIALQKPRNSNIKNHVNLTYNLSWIFVSAEPLLMRASAPFFPSVSPTPNAKMAFGEFDIGKWFRPFQLDYHIPLENKSFEIEAGQPLAFLEFMTDKKIQFQRFNLTKNIHEIISEASASNRYFKGFSLAQRYAQAAKSGVQDILISEIRKNLITQ